jgi:hypothetical protein
VSVRSDWFASLETDERLVWVLRGRGRRRATLAEVAEATEMSVSSVRRMMRRLDGERDRLGRVCDCDCGELLPLRATSRRRFVGDHRKRAGDGNPTGEVRRAA